MSALDDAARELHQEGYEEGCNDGYRKALDDVLELVDQAEEPYTVDELIAEVAAMRRRAR